MTTDARARVGSSGGGGPAGHAPAPSALAAGPPWWMAAPLMALAALAAYVPSLGGGRVWDDTFLVGENPFFRSPVFLFEVFRQWLWIDPIAAYYRPVQNWSFMADYLAWGEWFPGYRLTSLLCHLAAGLLLWRLLDGMFRDGGGADSPDAVSAPGAGSLAWAAWLAALAWLVHPAHNAAVAYVSGRADPLAALFALSGWLLWRRAFSAAGAKGRTPWGFFAASAAVLCLLLSLCSRETGVLWLVAFAGYEGFVRGDRTRLSALSACGVSLALAALYAWLRTLPPDLWPKPEGIAGAPAPAAKLADSLLALGDYAALFGVPTTLSMERRLAVEGWGAPLLVGAALLLAATLAAACSIHGATRRLRVFFCLWFVAGFLAICPLFAPNATVAEHWMYFPFAGLLGALSLAAAELGARLPRAWRRVGVGAALCWIVLMGVRTSWRAADWHGNEVFLAATLAHGDRTSRIEGLAAANLARGGRVAEAEALLRKAVARRPEDRLLPLYLGSVLEASGRLDEALPLVSLDSHELSALRGLHPLVALAPLTRARILVRQDNRPAAIEVLEDAAALWPGHWKLHAALAALHAESANPKAAIATLARFLERNPWHLDASLRLASLLSLNGHPDLAARLLEAARLLDLRSPEPDRLLAGVHADHAQWQDAIAAQKRAFARSGGADADARALRALADAARQ